MVLLGISGSLTPNPRTLAVVRLVLDQATAAADVETWLLGLRQLDIAFCDGRNPADYAGDTGWAIETITVPGAIYARNARFAGGVLVDEAVRQNRRRLAGDIVRLWRTTQTQGSATGPAYPTIHRCPTERV